MAEDTRDAKAVAKPVASMSSTSAAHPGAPGAAGPAQADVGDKKPSKGIILGKDGKPCRTCNTLANFTTHSKSALAGTSSATTPSVSMPRQDCPPDVAMLGRSSWNLLHAISATYPERPTRVEQTQMQQFMGLFAKFYPCWVCAEDFTQYLERQRPVTESREGLGRWLCGAHNEVNRKLGKPEFDCDLWRQRWVDGWKDGSCG